MALQNITGLLHGQIEHPVLFFRNTLTYIHLLENLTSHSNNCKKIKDLLHRQIGRLYILYVDSDTQSNVKCKSRGIRS